MRHSSVVCQLKEEEEAEEEEEEECNGNGE